VTLTGRIEHLLALRCRRTWRNLVDTRRVSLICELYLSLEPMALHKLARSRANFPVLQQRLAMASIFDFHPDDFKNLKNRRIRALLPQGLETPRVAARFNLRLPPGAVSYRSLEQPTVHEAPAAPLDIDTLNDIWTNVQGDVFEEMPKASRNWPNNVCMRY
jgi:hypothetical protein